MIVGMSLLVFPFFVKPHLYVLEIGLIVFLLENCPCRGCRGGRVSVAITSLLALGENPV
jgi:hypothetical protein